MGRRKFLAERRGYLSSSASYTEIDLLRGGERELPASLDVLAAYPFIAWASQAQVDVRHHWGWGWDEDDPLPTLGVPLEYPRIHPLDLSLCYRRAYERNRWDERLQLAVQRRR